MDAENVATEGPRGRPTRTRARSPKFDDWMQTPEAGHCGLTTSVMAV